MELITITLIAVGLAMDAFAVSIASGVTIKDMKFNYALRIAVFFGLFQAFMPLVGWLAGLNLKNFVEDVSHWIAFALLTIIGFKMIYESVKMDGNTFHPLNLHILMILSIATSIDALAVGISFAFLKISIATPILIIGTITFLLSFVGVFIGDKFGHFFEKKMEIGGGVILIGIGIKILVEHLF